MLGQQRDAFAGCLLFVLLFMVVPTLYHFFFRSIPLFVLCKYIYSSIICRFREMQREQAKHSVPYALFETLTIIIVNTRAEMGGGNNTVMMLNYGVL